jgi:hypothetical protein
VIYVNDDFSINLMRLIAAQQFYMAALQTSREMFGKSYFSLGTQEKNSVDQTMLQNIGANYQQINADTLKTQGVTVQPTSGKPN